MINALEPIINEISIRIIEWSPKQRIKLNLFEEVHDPGIVINSFNSINQYRIYLSKMYIAIKGKIEVEISQNMDIILSIQMLEECKIILHENMLTHLPENFDLILFSLVFKTPGYQKDIMDIRFKEKVQFFIMAQKELINKVVDFIGHNIRVIKELNEFSRKNMLKQSLENINIKQGQISLFPTSEIPIPKMLWTKSENALLEILLGLHETGAVISENGKITQRQAIQWAEHSLGIKIKSAEVKISKLHERKKSETPFLDEMKGSINKRGKRLETEKQKRK